MSILDFVTLLARQDDMDKKILFNVFLDGKEIVMAVDGIDEASDEQFVGINLKEIM